MQPRGPIARIGSQQLSSIDLARLSARPLDNLVLAEGIVGSESTMRRARSEGLEAENDQLRETIEAQRQRILSLQKALRSGSKIHSFLMLSEKMPSIEIIHHILNEVQLCMGSGQYVGILRYMDETKLKVLAFSDTNRLNTTEEIRTKIHELLNSIAQESYEAKQTLAGLVLQDSTTILSPEILALDKFNGALKETGLEPVASLAVKEPIEASNGKQKAFAVITVYRVAEDKPAGILTNRDVANFEEYLASPGVANVIKSAVLLKQLRDEYAKRAQAQMSDLNLASLHQRSLLPAQSTHADGVEISAITKPTIKVGGDIYYFMQVGDITRVWVIDVVGKNVSASILAGPLQVLLYTASEMRKEDG
ncbi:hypothetical protein HY570_02260, partial [Candidatus Micrarchaeota archaeon]|nr:hypothetical protein [Candidatus Micrarchaeota archaeon]